MNASETLQLNCPKCQRQVRVRATSVGKRVRCPRCEAAFKIPGQQAPPDDDDDWLNLDDPDPQTPPKGGVEKPPSPAGGSSSSPPSGDRAVRVPADEEGLDDFMLRGEDLPPPKKPAAPAHGQGEGGFSDAEMAALNAILKSPQGSDPADPGNRETASPGAEPDDAEAPVAGEWLGDEDIVSEFRVTCPICQSLRFVRTDQVGQQIKCPDCYSMMVVPPPPKAKKRYQPDIENAESYVLSEAGEVAPVYGGPMSRSAAELLRDAEGGDEERAGEAPRPRDEYDNPDVQKWLAGIFGIFRDPGVILHVIVLSLLGCLPGVAAATLGHPGVTLISNLLTAIFFIFVLGCGFSILEAVANGQAEVEEWPYQIPGEGLGRMLTALAAAALAGGPAAVLGGVVFGPGMAMAALTMFSLYIFFPFVLLSMLDSESIFVPFSAEVSKSVGRCQEAWGILYLSSGLLFFALLLLYVIANLLPETLTAFLVVAGTVAAIFTYFSMIGQVAYAIGQAVNAPPMQNDIDEVRARERQRERAERQT